MQYIAFMHKEDNLYVATVPDLNYTSSFGDTFNDAVRNITEASELYCEDLDILPKARELEALERDDEVEDGDTPQLINVKVEKNVRINVMIDTGLLKIANDRAKKEYNGNRSAYIQDLISRDASLGL
jgi:predicted RNase H-like HicB family nuclease